jgi:hypothetical protein
MAFRLNRRAALRGIIGGSAVMVGLPTLEIMLNSNGTALADGHTLPLRFVAFYWADGVNIGRFEPAQTGANWALSEEMQPLQPVKEYINLVTGLQNHCENTMTHHEGMTVFNGYSYIQQGGGLVSNAGGPTLDQLIADKIGDATTIRAIHCQVSKRDSTDGDDGTTTIAMSHRGTPGNLIAQTPQVNPVLVYQTLFGVPIETVDTRPVRKRVLDAVKEDAARLNGKLGKLDKQRLDAHLQAVAELEAKILAAPPACEVPAAPTETNTDVGGEEPLTAVNQVMADLIKHAFVCDQTRVATVLFKRFVSGTVFDEINANEIHHNASHQQSEAYHDGIVFQMQRLADLLVTLKNEPDGAGNLLDSTIVYASTDCSQGHSHSIARQPIILAGHGRNYLAHPGIHYQPTPWNGSENGPNATGNTSDALFTCLRAWDEAAPSIGAGAPQSSSVISDILA